MVDIPSKIVITGMICLAVIYVALMICQRDDSTVGFLIIGAIAYGMGVVTPAPKIDKQGVMKW
jgi:1,4-dihydroxy-2-naphthoate octaprenyltransferase